MTDSITGKIFDIQHFSVSDGPGIRTTVFLKGCPLRCRWCHNPESYENKTQIMYYSNKCVLCGRCVQACPNQCHTISGNVHSFDRSKCISCHKCADVCAFGSLVTAGREASVAEVMKEVLGDRYFYEYSGGGLTLSGGEPMFQPEFTVALARSAKENGLHVCMETSGFARSELYTAVLPFVDLFLFDFKCADDGKHKEYTGVSNGLILDNLKMLDSKGAKIILRCPIIPGSNTFEWHYAGIINTVRQLHCVAEINLEPYHNVGVSKHQSLGDDAQPMTPPGRELLNKLAERIESETSVKTLVM